MNLVGMANSIIQNVASAVARLGLDLAKAVGFTVDRVETSAKNLRQAVENAIEADRKEANSFWADFKAVFKHGLAEYWSEKQRFDREVKALVDRAREELDRVDDLVAWATQRVGDVPDQLDSAGRTGRRRRRGSVRSRARSRVCRA